MASSTALLHILFHISLFCSAVAPAATLASSYSQPLPCFGFCLALDPSLIRRDDGVYFRYNTNGGVYFQKSSGTGSAGIAGPWTDMGPALPGRSIIDPSVKNVWAPDVRKVGDQYIMYYAVSVINTRKSKIGWATSPNLEKGSWTDHGALGISTTDASPYNAIDPALIWANGQYHLTFGSYWEGLHLVPLNANANGLTAPFPTYVQQIEYQPAGAHATEASFIYQFAPPGDSTAYYYLFWSEGRANLYDEKMPGPGEEYKIRVCRSTVVGRNYVDASGRSCLSGYGETVLASHGQVYGPGAQGIVDDPCGPIMYYAYANTTESIANINYKWGVNYLSWTNGWPIVAGAGSNQPLGFCSKAAATSSAKSTTAASASRPASLAAAATSSRVSATTSRAGLNSSSTAY